MSDARFKYWEECIAVAAEECELKLTPEQLQYMAGAVEGAHENHGMAFYQPDSPYPSQIRELERKLQLERAKVVCKECGGRGRIITNGPCRSSDMQCGKCQGEGKVAG
jgi:hypothetical protein